MLSLILAAGAQATTVRAGLNLSKLAMDPEPEEGEMKFAPGFHVSVAKEYMRSWGELTIGVGLENRGHKYEVHEEDDYYYSYVDLEETVTLMYLTVPVGMQWENKSNPGTRGFFVVRAVPSILLSAQYEFEYDDGYDQVSDDTDIKDDLNAFDLMAEIEGGISLPRAGLNPNSRWLVSAAFGFGLFNVLDVPGNDEWKNRVFRIFGGMTF